MNFKKYHVSRNLIDIRDFTATTTPTSQDGVLWTGTLAEGTYTFSINQDDTLTSSLRNTIHIKIGSTNYYESTSANYHNNSGRHSYTFTVPDATTIIEIRYWTNDISNDCSFSQGMLNEGSTALPYEPYSSEVWHDIPHYVHKTDTDTITTLPADLYADGTNATVGLVGNMSQTGTPTPQNPIQPSECGDRTENLLDADIYYGTFKQADGTYQSARANLYNVQIKPFKADDIGKTFTFVADISPITGNARLCANINGTIVSGSNTEKSVVTFTVETADDSIFFNYGSGSTTVTTLSEIMLVQDSTALPYEPYGYKLGISSGDITTTIYLGEVQSTRKIKKYECTGDESWSVTSAQGKTRAVANFTTSIGIVPLSKVVSTHYIGVEGGAGYPDINTITVNNNGTMIIGISSEYTDTNAFKAYLAAQYAAGTPVTVWYVLATETTGIVNEPLRKIGDYADTVSGITIPTITGKDTFDVQTTLKPSEVSLSYTGWHDATVKEWDGSQWD